MTIERDELTDEERRALLDLAHWEIENSRFPLSERIRLLKRIRIKLESGGQGTAEGGRPATKAAALMAVAAAPLRASPIENSSVRVGYGCKWG